ncbi:MAG: iron-sulfur cluster assembly accessory protein [Bacteroidota bacterium]
MIQPVTFSKRAIEEAMRIMAEQNLSGEYVLRVAVGGGGCSGGIAPILGFDKQKGTDIIYDISGVKIVVDKKHVMHLIGKHVEYHEVEDVSGFHFMDVPLKLD